MVLNAKVIANNSIEETEEQQHQPQLQQSPQMVVNTTNFNNEDLEEFVNISEEIERASRERRSLRRRSRSRSNTMVATMTREEIFECTNVDDDQFLKAMEHQTSYETSKDRAALVNSIENLMKYFDEEVTVIDDSLVKASPVKKLPKGKVASAVASFRSKCNLTPSPMSKRKKQQSLEVKTNIQELKKKYETSLISEASPSPKATKTKSPKLSRKTKVKQMALLFNNKINSIIRSSSPEPQTPEPVSPGIESIASITSPNFTSTLKPKSPKFKSKFPKFVAKLPSPKPSPLFKRKQLQKSPSITSLSQSPQMKRKELQKQPSTTCLVAESVFSQLSVKDKALLYNKFIADMSKHNPKFSKHAEVLESNVKKEIQRGEVICEKQNSVKHLRDSLEAKLTPSKALSKTLQRFKRSSSKLSLDLTPKAKEFEDILATDISCSQLEDDSQDLLHVSTLTVVLKSSPESKKCNTKTKSLRKKKDVTFSEDNSIIEPSFKRTQTMIRSSFCVEPYAPPKKIRRTQHERLAPKMFFQNQHLEKLFYHWLKEKNGVAFDITAVNDKNDIIEIVPKNSRDDVLPAQTVNEILEAAISNLESKKEKEEQKKEIKKETSKQESAIALIKNTLENEQCLEKSVIEVELPLEMEASLEENKDNETEDSDLGLTSINKTTSEDSLIELQSPEVSTNLSGKPMRKKKLRRSLTLRKEHSILEPNTLFSTDSDSDCKTPKVKPQSCTLPKSKKCSNYVKKLVFKTLNSSMPAEPSQMLNNELSILELDRSLIRQVNSPSKIKNAYTLTVMSSPSPHSESDFYDSDRPRTPMKESSRSWPSLLEAQMEEDLFSLKDKAVSTEFTDMSKGKLEKEQQKLLMDSFIDQGFETGSNDMDSPLRMPRKLANVMENSVTKRENPNNFSTPLKDKPVQRVFTALQGSQTQAQLISPIQAIQSPRRPASLTMTVIKEDSYPEESQELYNTPSSLNDSQTFFGQEETEAPLGVTHKVNSSQFWVTSGDFTAAMTIHHYESERLMLLSNIFAQKSLETKEMNFGIDQHKFCLDNSATSDDILKKVPQENNCSQYWFSTGDVLIPFTGKQLSSKKIQSFFGYIREFMEESGSLRFGIDSYEFSNIYQQTHNNTSHFMANTWTQAVSPLKTSDLDQSDLDSEEFEQSLTFSAISHHSDTASLKSDVLINPQQNSFRAQQSSASLEQIFEDARHLNLSKTQTDKQALEEQFTVPEMLKTLQNQQTKLKSLEERMLQCTDSAGAQKVIDINESPEYMRKLRSIISAIDNIGRGNGFNACTIEQLESFMFFLSRYADLCLANCTAHIEKILDVVMNQRSFQV